MLRYTNHSKQGDLELAPASTSCSTEDVSQSSLVVDGFNQRLLALLEVLRIEAAAGGDCSSDLKELDCDNCLEEGFGSIQSTLRTNIFPNQI
ncbi:cysteine-rich receptor-like protein kinase 25 [Prunus yedoensis var. nudiflora]|uniref:Cysteine-rich receptor-like protein kinase 25 n=1 Tax=Prunus yedoensis var. nudiflora TaxID=2094558 RepID=A0A314YC78_PRUYE|nr:cysteine-rich receptor-like protein kinase 25 [Prunus yedoensis var. nudiflora]